MSLSLVRALDELYEGVVMSPAEWPDERFGEWMESVDPIDREGAKILGRGLRKAKRLRKYWMDRDGGESDWHQRVDQALGGEGWRVSLDLARWSLARQPDEQVFGVMAERFRWVKFTPFPQSFEEWAADRDRD